MFVARTADQISQSLRQEIKAQLSGSAPDVWPNNLYIVTKAVAQTQHLVELRLEWVHRQAFASTAEIEFLDLHGEQLGVNRAAAAFATGTAAAATVIGTTIPSGAVLTRADGELFETLTGVTATATVTALELRAQKTGRVGNTEGATSLPLVTPISGVGAIVAGTDGIRGGAEEETDESYRARILQRKRNPPRGGSPNEYMLWSLAKPGVTRVFVRRATPAAGSVTVYFMMDDNSVSGIPSSAEVTDLQTRLNALAPADATVIAAAPTALTVAIVIDTLTPDNQLVRNAVEAEIKAIFRRRAEPGTAAVPFIFSRSWISKAISSAPGELKHKLSAPSADVSCGSGQIAVPGTISYI